MSKFKRGDLLVLRDNKNFGKWAEVGDIFIVLRGNGDDNWTLNASRIPGPLGGHELVYIMYAYRFEKVGEVPDAEREAV